MSSIRLFIDQHISMGCIITLDLKQMHYLQSVMRLKDNQAITIFNDSDGEWQAIIEGSYRNSINLKVLEFIRPIIIERDLCLCFALVKWKALSNLIRQATESGATKLQPVLTEHTVIRNININKLQACAIEAVEQSGRFSIPKIMDLITFDDMCDLYKDNLVICDETNQGDDLHAMLPNMTSITLMIGPEGGFSPRELQYKSIRRASLGEQILRVDTAAVTALAYAKALLGKDA